MTALANSGIDRKFDRKEFAGWLQFISNYRPDTVFVMLEVSIDASGSHKEASAYCVASCAGVAGEWGNFMAEWAEVLQTLQLQGPYHAKNRECKARANGPLAKLIAKHLQFSYAVTISVQDFLRETAPEYREDLGPVYAECLDQTLSEMCDRSKRGNLGRVSFVIEHGDVGWKKARSVLGYLQAETDSVRDELCIGSITWSCKSESPLEPHVLHPVDLVAFSVSQDYGKDQNQIVADLRTAGKLVIKHLSAGDIGRGQELWKTIQRLDI